MQADKHKTYLCAHTHWQGPEAHTRPEGITGCGSRGGGLGARVSTRSRKQNLPQTTHIQQTVNILTIEHVYKYATLLLGVRVCLGGVRIDT